MNRRNFISGLLSAAASFAILPGATLYTRQWKQVAVAGPLLTYWEQRSRVSTFYSQEYEEAINRLLAIAQRDSERPYLPMIESIYA